MGKERENKDDRRWRVENRAKKRIGKWRYSMGGEGGRFVCVRESGRSGEVVMKEGKWGR